MITIDGVEMIGVQEAARLTRRTPETVRRWVWSGRLGATKQGNRLLVSRVAVAALAGREPTPARTETPRLSLADWAARVSAGRHGSAGTTAADLVWDDRAGR
jgi:excisionase family DNA binding protein